MAVINKAAPATKPFDPARKAATTTTAKPSTSRPTRPTTTRPSTAKPVPAIAVTAPAKFATTPEKATHPAPNPLPKDKPAPRPAVVAKRSPAPRVRAPLAPAESVSAAGARVRPGRAAVGGEQKQKVLEPAQDLPGAKTREGLPRDHVLSAGVRVGVEPIAPLHTDADAKPQSKEPDARNAAREGLRVPSRAESCSSASARSRPRSTTSPSAFESKLADAPTPVGRERFHARAEVLSGRSQQTSLSSASARSRPRSTTSPSAFESELADAPTRVGRANTERIRARAEVLSGRSQQTSLSSRTPSPDLPAINGVDTPVAENRRAGPGMGVLGMGTPEVDRWIEAGRGEGRRVLFKDGDDGGDTEESDEDTDPERERSMRLQLSPRRSGPPTPAHAGTAGTGAHDLLRTIVRDALHELQRETRAGLTGLHLDVLRAGRGWRRELRDAMQEGGWGPGGEVEWLRGENRRLREENERLRRGW